MFVYIAWKSNHRNPQKHINKYVWNKQTHEQSQTNMNPTNTFNIDTYHSNLCCTQMCCLFEQHPLKKQNNIEWTFPNPLKKNQLHCLDALFCLFVGCVEMYVAVFTIYFLLHIGNELIAFFVPKNMFLINSYLFCIVFVI